jgi:hypothetical protein
VEDLVAEIFKGVLWFIGRMVGDVVADSIGERWQRSLNAARERTEARRARMLERRSKLR